jgi:cytochrome c-type biogenesis protein CcmE
MNPQRKRKIRLVVALGTAVVLAGALVYSTFTASTEARSPSQLLHAGSDHRSYELTGKVEPGYHRDGDVLVFRVRDRAGNAAVPVRYSGAVPDPFREGREVIVTVQREGDVFVGKRDSLITKCPSKFKAAGGKA